MKTCWVFAFLLSSLVMAPMAEAQTRQARNIESKLTRTLNTPQGQSTMGMVNAFDEAAKAYAVEIGRVYRKLEKGLPVNQRETLVHGQLAWQEYLKNYRAFISYVYDADGTMHKHMAMSYLKEMLRHRLEELCCFFMRTEKEFSEDVPAEGDWCAEKHENLGLEDPLAPASQAASLPGAPKNQLP